MKANSKPSMTVISLSIEGLSVAKEDFIAKCAHINLIKHCFLFVIFLWLFISI